METRRQPEPRTHPTLGILLVATLMLAGSGLWVFGERTESPVTLQAGAGRATVWDGVYTDAQAAIGRQVFDGVCFECHGPNLEGEDGPPLKGERFMEEWREDTVGSLYSEIRSTMPRRRAPLSDSEYFHVVTYILQANGFPAGKPLSAETFNNVWIERKDGPQPLPTNSLVKVVGCMTPAGKDEWDLAKASMPMRDRNPDPDAGASPEELKAAMELAADDQKFRLQNFFMLGMFEPGQYEGHKMLAKGALLRQPTGDRISLTSLDMVAESCSP